MSKTSKQYRLFIAITYQATASVKQLFEDLQELATAPKTRLRVVPENNLHITLRFLGNVQEDVVKGICLIMDTLAAETKPISLTLEGFGCFKNALWLGVTQSDALHDLVTSLDRELTTIGFSGDSRRFLPHLTVARIGREGKLKISSLQQKYGESRWGSAEVKAIHLYKSDTLPTGAVYEILHSSVLSQSKKGTLIKARRGH